MAAISGSTARRGPSARIDDLGGVAATLGADVELAAPDQRIAGNQGEVHQHLDRGLAQRRLVDHPAELDLAVRGEQALDRDLRLARIDQVAEAAGRAESEPEEFELVGR